MMKFEIKNRWSGKVQLECELAAEFETKSYSIQLGAAVKLAVASGASLDGASLVGARLDGASLDGASLDGASLDGARLELAELTPIQADFLLILSHAPMEVPALIAALDDGRVNGSTYSDGECGCLIGTLAIAAGADKSSNEACREVHGLRGKSTRPAEMFFLAINKGDTPNNSQHAAIARKWASDWLSRMQFAFAPASTNAIAYSKTIEVNQTEG